MAVYVMSDLHGCKNEFDQMLSLIDFNDYDELYILGDVCDRGYASIPLLLEIMQHSNMHLILGNHDDWLLRYAQRLIDSKKNLELINQKTIPDDMYAWLYYNGGFETADEFLELDTPICYDIQEYLEQAPIYKELKVGTQDYLLIHAGLGQYSQDPFVKPFQIDKKELLWSHIGLDDCPYQDTTLIVGHIPTFAYGDEFNGTIAKGHANIYHIDCGCVYGKKLGCLRLDNLKEFYIPSSFSCFKKQVE